MRGRSAPAPAPDDRSLPDLPAGWTWVTGDELFATVTSGSRGWARYYADAGALFLRIGNLDHASISLDLSSRQSVCPPDGAEGSRTKVLPGDLLVSITADIGMVGLVPDGIGEAYVNQHICLARPVKTANGKYVAWYLASEDGGQRQFRQLQRGATKAGLGLDDVQAVSIPMPPPAEQHRIVAEIEKQFSRLDAGVAALERVRAGLKRYRAAVLQAACTGRLVPTEAGLGRAEGRDYEPAGYLLGRILAERRARWEEEQRARMAAQGRLPLDGAWKAKYRGPATPDTGDLPDLPEGWAWATAEQLSDETRSITYGVVKLGDPVDGGVPTLRSSNVRHLRLELDEVKCISPSIADAYRRTMLRGGELLVTVRGTLGGVVQAPPSCAGCNVSREVAVLALVDDRVGPAAALFIGSKPVQNWLMRNARGIAYTGINIETLKLMPVPLPPLAEQQRIVAEVESRLSVVDELEALVAANLKRAARLRQAILKRAFEGRLVPQDPNDEPASVLLERVPTR